MKYDAILFDLDGTLTESAEGITRSVAYSLEKRGYPVPDRSILDRFIGPPLTSSYRDYCGVLDPEEQKVLVKTYQERFGTIGWMENRVYPGIAPLLRALRDAGTYLAVVSAKPMPFVRQILDYFGLAPYFQKVCAFSLNDVQEAKTELLLSALPADANPSRCAMVGDRRYDMEAALEAKVAAIGAGYGYGTREELLHSGAQFLAETPLALSDYFLDGVRPRGRFLTFEGSDGCGKSTQMEKAREYLSQRGYQVLFTREPGGTQIGERIRELLLTQEECPMTPECEAYLFCASRSEHVRCVLRPALEEGKIILCDRFLDSSIAYQGWGRELGSSLVRQMNEQAVDGLSPDGTFWFRVDDTIAKSRIAHPDRIEREGDGFRLRVAQGYEILAREHPNRIHVIDAGGGIEDTFEHLKAILGKMGL